jgi:hypothetical protein
MQLELIKARTIEDCLPSNLSALRLMDVPTVGPSLRLCAVGDIGLSGRVGASLSRPGGSDRLLAEVAPLLKTVDISFGNLETPLTGDIAQGQLFSAPVAGAAMLKKSGFSLIHLANNHVYDYGQAGLVATMAATRNAGLIELGAGAQLSDAKQLVRTDVRGIRVGWLGCGRTLVTQSESGPNYWEFDEEELYSAVQRDRAEVDLLIVSIHIGLMHMDYPRPEHKIMAEKLLEAGAHLILMHHAHVLQGVQVTSKSAVCCYNLGNFLFDWEEGNVKLPVLVREQNEGAVFHFVVDGNGVAQATAFPIWVDEDCVVRWATGERGLEILGRLARISRDLESDYDLAFKRQRAERHTSSIVKVIWFHLCRGNLAFVVESARKVRLEHFGMIVRWLGGVARRIARGPVA